MGSTLIGCLCDWNLQNFRVERASEVVHSEEVKFLDGETRVKTEPFREGTENGMDGDGMKDVEMGAVQVQFRFLTHSLPKI